MRSDMSLRPSWSSRAFALPAAESVSSTPCAASVTADGAVGFSTVMVLP